jgi:hypothetical protein
MPPINKPSVRETFKASVQDSDKYYFEIQINVGIISWSNDSLKALCLKEDRSFVSNSIYGLVDESFRARLTSVLNEYTPKDLPRKTVWPVASGNARTTWWVINIESFDDEYLICNASPSISTDKSELGYKFASLSADNTFLASVALSEIANLHREISAFKKGINEDVKTSREQIESAAAAARKAEQAAIKNREATDDLKKHVIAQFSEHTKEITKLMTSDVVHDSRMAIFEEHVKKTTTEALTKIVTQADKSGRGLSRKVTIPVGISAMIMAFLQWIFTRYFH